MFLYFAEAGLDIAVIETGLGGRLDSTNVVRPLLSVITPIGFDHVEYLGYSIGSIAAEKGGIIKRETPVVVGTRQPEARTTLSSIAAQLASPAMMIEREFSYESHAPHHRLDYHGRALYRRERRTRARRRLPARKRSYRDSRTRSDAGAGLAAWGVGYPAGAQRGAMAGQVRRSFVLADGDSRLRPQRTQCRGFAGNAGDGIRPQRQAAAGIWMLGG